MQTDVLDGGPDNCQATRFCGEDVNLISALPNIAKQAFNSIRRLNVSVHGRRKLVKRQQVLFIFSQTSHRLWIAFAVFGFEGRQLGHCFLFAGLVPDPNEFGLYLSALASGDGIQDIALFMHQTALTKGG